MRLIILLILTTSCLQFKETVEVKKSPDGQVRDSTLKFKTQASSLDSRTYYNFNISDLKSRYPSIENMTIYSAKRGVRINLNKSDLTQTSTLNVRGFNDSYFAKVVTPIETFVLKLKIKEGHLTL